MGSVLDGLIRLQSIENRLRAAKSKLARCRRNVIFQENRVRTLQNALEAKKEEKQLTRVQSDRFELELKRRDESISRLRAFLNTAKTNKEYAGILTQLNTTRADNSKVEEQILELMKDIEADESECKELQKQIDEQKQELEQTRTQAESASVKHERDISEIQGQWDEQAKCIEAEALEIFQRVADTYDGEALAVIEPEEGKHGGYTCGGCFMGITAETVNVLMSKDEIIRCPNCTRILVLGEEGQGS